METVGINVVILQKANCLCHQRAEGQGICGAGLPLHLTQSPGVLSGVSRGGDYRVSNVL